MTNRIGKASVQNSAARSRTKLLRFARLSDRSARMPSLVAQGPAGQLEEHVLEGGSADEEVARLRAGRGGRAEEASDGLGDLLRIEQGEAVLAGDAGHVRQSRERGVGQRRHRIELDR